MLMSMNAESIRSLYGYNRWANERLRALAEALPPDRMHERLGASYESIHATLAHILAAEIIWLSRWRDVSPPKLLGADDFADLRAIGARWAAQQRDMDAFLGALTSDQLAKTVAYTNTMGERYAYPVWQMMVHLVNHGTHHRSELAEMLTQLGSPPPSLDLLVYYDHLVEG
jgi:uncharacterized damage-inducible protein DinB